MQLNKRYLPAVIPSFFTAIIVVTLYHYFFYTQNNTTAVIFQNTPANFNTQTTDNQTNNNLFKFANQYLTPNFAPDNNNFDFVRAASLGTPSVVHISATPETATKSKADGFFTENENIEGSQGSGVIVSKEGYIVTNQHVLLKNTNIEVTLFNKKKYKAQLIGRDENTDLALIKITPTSPLIPIEYGNSDALQVGEWVLAIGNPFSLNSTVTAGIVSAKARNINVLNLEQAVEAFIQTDAVVNVGNSGGALINTRGQLIGINTAIATFSGGFSGYAFAVPVDIVKKVIDDLRNFGAVQRAYIGVNVKEVTSENMKEYKLDEPQGVIVKQVITGSSAQKAGLQNEDVLLEVNGQPVNSPAQLQERIARYRPNDDIAITIMRRGVMQFITLKLRNEQQTTETVKSDAQNVEQVLGGEFKNLSLLELQHFGIKGGVRVESVGRGLLKNNTEIKEGFIILKVNNKSIKNLDEFYKIFKDLKNDDAVTLQGIYLSNPRNKLLYALTYKANP